MLKYSIGATLALLIIIGLLYAQSGRLKEDNQTLRERVSSYEQQIVNLREELELVAKSSQIKENSLITLKQDVAELKNQELVLLDEIELLYNKNKIKPKEGENNVIVENCPHPYSAIDYSPVLRKAFDPNGD